MKRRISITLTILSMLLALGLLRLWLPASVASGPLPALQGEAALNHLKEQGLYGSLQEAVTAARYGLYKEPKKSDAWLADNHAQRLHARFTPDGLQVETRGDAGRSHRLGMKLRSAGYGERQVKAKAGRLTASGARAEIHYELQQSAAPESQSAIPESQSAIPESQSVITEWYHNTAAGLEQGFTIESPPSERRDGDRLRVALAPEGDLRAEAVDGGQAIEFIDDTGQRALRYDHLVVNDAEGRELEARMTVSKEGSEVWLEVDDRNAVWPVTIDPTFTQQQKLRASAAAADDWFGGSVAISGETVVVGAYMYDGAGGFNQGSAYVFVRSGGVWSQQQKLLASDAAAGAWFGESVAISGETVVVGAPGDNGAAGKAQGSAYFFARSGGVWSQQQKLFASNAAAGDSFGSSVAISGETVVIGAPGNSLAKANPGSAYVFVRGGGVWSQRQKLLAWDAAKDASFGQSVAISGETVVVGAQFDGAAAGKAQGSAYVFARSGGVWNQQQKLLASDAAAGDFFGSSVAISGETVVIGAPGDDRAAGKAQGAVYVFVRSGGVWSQQQKLVVPFALGGAKFGASVAIGGETVVVGANTENIMPGSAYVFARSGGVWSEQEYLASGAILDDSFGSSVAISGGTIVIGAPAEGGATAVGQGSVCVFMLSGGVRSKR